jgi:hypothetical protein
MKLITELNTEEVVTETNKNFRIKVVGINYVGKAISTSVGFAGLADILQDEGLAKRICKKALESTLDIYEHKLRRGLRLKFESR